MSKKHTRREGLGHAARGTALAGLGCTEASPPEPEPREATRQNVISAARQVMRSATTTQIKVTAQRWTMAWPQQALATASAMPGARSTVTSLCSRAR